MSNIQIPAIKASKNETEFLVELYNQFGGNDQIATTELKFGEEVREDVEELMKISSRPTLYGLIKFTAKWVSKTKEAVKFNDEFRSCRLAKNTSHKVRLVVDGKEITETSNFVKKVTKKATKAAKKAEKARVKRARKARAEKRDFIKYEMNDLHARMFEAKELHSNMKELAEALIEKYNISMTDAMRHVIEGGKISLKIYGNFNRMAQSAVNLVTLELNLMRTTVFAKVHKGKVITSNRLCDLENIKGKLFITNKDKAEKLIARLSKKVNRIGKVIKDRFTARLLASGFEL